MQTINNVVNYKKRFLATTLILVMLTLLFGCGSKEPQLKGKEFESPVNEEVSTQADLYFKDVKKDDKVSFMKSDLDYKKLGTYDVKMKYSKKEYAVKIKIVDKIPPTIKLNKKLFTFSLKTSVEDVNKAINKDILISDNYDKTFNAIKAIDKVPNEEKEITCKLTVKDTSDNVSNPVEIKVQFTKDGKEKKNLKQESKKVEMTVNKENENSTGKTENKKEGNKTSTNTNKPKENSTSNSGSSSKPANKPTNNGGSSSNGNTSSNTGNTNKPVTKPNNPAPAPSKPNNPQPSKPAPAPQPPKPQEKPVYTVENCIAEMGGMGGYERIFATYDEAYNWWNTQVTTPGSPHYNPNNPYGDGTIQELTSPYYQGAVYGVGF